MMSSFITIATVLCCIATVCMATDSNPTIQFTITEEVNSGFKVGSVADESRQFLDTNRTDLIYNFLSQTEAQSLFSISDETGAIFTIVKIDREHVCKEYETECVVPFDVAVSSIDLQFIQIVSVNIYIEDINDNAPMFPSNVYHLNISEGRHVGSTYTIDPAVDKDTGAGNSIQSYELVLDEASTGFFSLNVTKNYGRFSLKLVLDKILNREVKDTYNLKVIARDAGDPQKSGLLTININVLDTNDNSPVFSQKFYNVTIKENTGAMETILTLSADDKDLGENSQITYRISDFQKDKDIVDALFEITPVTGELKVKSDLTSFAGEFYRVLVEAVDHGAEPLMSQVEVEVHIEDSGNNAPTVSVSFLSPGNTGFVNISENAKNATFVAHVNVEDPDKGLNGEVSCGISSKHFAVVKMDKGYKVVVNAVLDREVLNNYNLTVTCYDKGTPVMSASTFFTVRITDYNDNKPIFTKDTYTAKITENNVGNEMILQVTASDADIGNNAIVHFRPHDDVKGRFIVDNNTGVISANAIFDREYDPVITFRVLAVDGGNPVLTGTATVVLTITDQNDNAPKFALSVHGFTVLENQPTGTDVDTLTATDLDTGSNAEFDFAISDDYLDNVPFVLFSNGLLKANKQLDREERSRYDFVVVVTDRGDHSLSSMAHVTVIIEDVNDNSPIVTFPRPSNNTVSVLYPDFETTYVTSIEAYDLDDGQNKELVFSIKSGNDMNIFDIDADTGDIHFATQIDIGSNKLVSLEISVKDKGDIPRETVTTLNVDLKYTNATFLLSTDQSENSKYIIISVTVVVVTLLISGGIIGVILFLRLLDKKRKLKKADDSCTTIESDFGFSPMTQSHTVISPDTLSSGSSEGHDLIKKKEVSFVLDTSESYEYHQQRQNSSTSMNKDKPSKSSLRYSPQQFPPEYSPAVLDTRELQNEANVQLHSMKLQQVLLQNRAKHWVEQQQQQQQYGNIGHPPDDHTSEGSADTIGSDSGRGCSEEDDFFSSPSTDDPKTFDISSPESQRSSSYMSSSKDSHPLPHHPANMYTKQPWTRKPHLNLARNYTNNINKQPSHVQLNINRNLNSRQLLASSDSASSVTTDLSHVTHCPPPQAWGSACNYYANSVMPMDYEGDSALHSFFTSTPLAYNMREEDDTCSTTTSGSYTVYSEEIL